MQKVSRSEILEKLHKIDILISVEAHEKERVRTVALGVLPCLLGILGLTS